MSRVVRIGLLDSGVAPDQTARVVAAAAFHDGRHQPDRLGHGAALARIILAHAPDAALLDAQIFGERLTASPATVAAGLDWLRARGATLINLSFGLARDRLVLAEAVAAARAAGIVLIASVPARGEPVFPGAYPGVIRVTGDARCGLAEVSALAGAPADYGACPKDAEGRLGGASYAAAHVTGRLAGALIEGGEARACLDRLARFRGREHRLA